MYSSISFFIVIQNIELIAYINASATIILCCQLFFFYYPDVELANEEVSPLETVDSDPWYYILPSRDARALSQSWQLRTGKRGMRDDWQLRTQATIYPLQAASGADAIEAGSRGTTVAAAEFYRKAAVLGYPLSQNRALSWRRALSQTPSHG